MTATDNLNKWGKGEHLFFSPAAHEFSSLDIWKHLGPQRWLRCAAQLLAVTSASETKPGGGKRKTALQQWVCRTVCVLVRRRREEEEGWGWFNCRKIYGILLGISHHSDRLPCWSYGIQTATEQAEDIRNKLKLICQTSMMDVISACWANTFFICTHVSCGVSVCVRREWKRLKYL